MRGILSSNLPHGFFAQGVLLFKKARVKIGVLRFKATAFSHRTAMRGEVIER
jgi:hypothetical protein